MPNADFLQRIVLRIWETLERYMGYHRAIELKEWLTFLSGCLLSGLIAFLITSWLNLQWDRNSKMEELSTAKVGGHIYSNPNNLRELIDTYIGVLFLKLFPHHTLKPRRVRLARNIVIGLIVLGIILAIIGVALSRTISLPKPGEPK